MLCQRLFGLPRAISHPFIIGFNMAEDIIKIAKDKLKADQEYWGDIYKKAKEDAKFLSDDDFAQWDEQDYANRTGSGRPALTIDQLGQFVHQVVNDIRINTPTINIIPVGFDSKPEIAETYKGLIKSIEYASSADNAYDTAVFNSVKQSIGFIRVDHDYVDDESFDQELKICRVVNPLSCWLDGASLAIDGSDAMHGTIIEKVRVSEFKKKHPKFDAVCFEADNTAEAKDDEFISIAEHFYIDETEKTVSVDDSGKTYEVKEGAPVKKIRKVKNRVVRRLKLSGADILEETTFPGKYIPLIPVYGEENWIDGKRYVFSLIRKSKDAQRMFNYWKSLETELLMKAPQAPIMAAEGQVDDYAADWTNPSKAAVLRYKTTDANGNPIGAPQRLEPPTIPTGVVNASRGAVDDIKATMGIYNASLGIRSNEQSGVAIAQRKQEGDVATYHFADNLSKAITHVGRVLVCAIPEIYDTARVLRIIGAEDEPKQIGVNGEIVEDQEETIDLAKGKYDVRVVTGASYTTLRQESVEALQAVFTASPELMSVMGDLYFKYSDFAGAQAMANRMKKVVDPKFLEPDEREEDEQPVVDPEKEQMAGLIQQGQVALQQMQQEMTSLKSQLENKQAETMIKAQEIEIKKEDIAIKRDSLALEAYKAQSETEIKNKEIEADLIKTRIESKATASPEMAMMDGDLNDGMPPLALMMAQFSEAINNGLMAVAQSQAQGNQAVIEALTKPKQVIRDETGKIAGVV